MMVLYRKKELLWLLGLFYEEISFRQSTYTICSIIQEQQDSRTMRVPESLAGGAEFG